MAQGIKTIVTPEVSQLIFSLRNKKMPWCQIVGNIYNQFGIAYSETALRNNYVSNGGSNVIKRSALSITQETIDNIVKMWIDGLSITQISIISGVWTPRCKAILKDAGHTFEARKRASKKVCVPKRKSQPKPDKPKNITDEVINRIIAKRKFLNKGTSERFILRDIEECLVSLVRSRRTNTGSDVLVKDKIWKRLVKDKIIMPIPDVSGSMWRFNNDAA